MTTTPKVGDGLTLDIGRGVVGQVVRAVAVGPGVELLAVIRIEDLPGPFDFIFIDADKNWALNYFKALLPKLAPGGCFAVHRDDNVPEGHVHRVGPVRGRRDYRRLVVGLAAGAVVAPADFSVAQPRLQ